MENKSYCASTAAGGVTLTTFITSFVGSVSAPIITVSPTVIPAPLATWIAVAPAAIATLNVVTTGGGVGPPGVVIAPYGPVVVPYGLYVVVPYGLYGLYVVVVPYMLYVVEVNPPVVVVN
jgi:hypothetical protein